MERGIDELYNNAINVEQRQLVTNMHKLLIEIMAYEPKRPEPYDAKSAEEAIRKIVGNRMHCLSVQWASEYASADPSCES